MESHAKLLGHSLHQMLVTFPIGAFGFSVACDALYAATMRRRYARSSRLALDFGLLTSIMAIPFGYVDYRAIDAGTRAKRVGLWHALGNATVVGLFATSRLLRPCGAAPRISRCVSGAGFLLTGVTAWLGGELISRHAIGVHDQAGQNAPSSLTKQPSVNPTEERSGTGA